jgi:Tfp pilus assembly protein PilF
MSRTTRRAVALATVLTLAGCQSEMGKDFKREFPLAHFKAEKMLDDGIRQYDEGNYKVAARNIQGALDLDLTTRSQARAHKYLAFISCVSDQQAQCREEFRKALEADPKLELKPEEVGHPIWGPVFRSVKTQTSSK